MARLWRALITLSLLGCIALLAALAPVRVAPVGAAPSLDLNPWRGPCTTKVAAQGTAFDPGRKLRFTIQLDGTTNDRALTFGETTVGPDGAFQVTVDLARYIPDCAAGTVPNGTQYRLSALDAGDSSLLAFALFIIAPTDPTPLLTLDPSGGPCTEQNPLIVVHGTGFPPNVIVSLDVRDNAGGNPSTFPGGTTGADGLLTAGVRLIGCGPDTAAGATFTVTATGGDPPLQLATATYATSPTAGDKQCFTETNQCIQGRFLARWRDSGGLAVNGFPLSGEFKQKLEDGKEYTVQYFERVRLEYHPENAPPEDIQLGQFGRHILESVPGAPTASVSPREGGVHFAETGHNVAPDFFAFWQNTGGLAQFGYPLTEEFTQTLEDGKQYTVQYFERARFERHPENQPPYTILLGQFGRRILAETPH